MLHTGDPDAVAARNAAYADATDRFANSMAELYAYDPVAELGEIEAAG